MNSGSGKSVNGRFVRPKNSVYIFRDDDIYAIHSIPVTDTYIIDREGDPQDTRLTRNHLHIRNINYTPCGGHYAASDAAPHLLRAGGAVFRDMLSDRHRGTAGGTGAQPGGEPGGGNRGPTGGRRNPKRPAMPNKAPARHAHQHGPNPPRRARAACPCLACGGSGIRDSVQDGGNRLGP